MAELYKKAAGAMLILALCLACYLLGRAQAETKIIKEKGEEIIREVEVIKYVEKEKSKIWRKPNADRTDLLKLMRENRL